MTRPSEITRQRILKAAERLFADRGYEETSIRAIVAKARVNQAAINYHFGGKDGLYREFADGFSRPHQATASIAEGALAAEVADHQRDQRYVHGARALPAVRLLSKSEVLAITSVTFPTIGHGCEPAHFRGRGWSAAS